MVQRLPVVKNLYRRSEVNHTMTQKKGSGKRQFCTSEGGARWKVVGPDVREWRISYVARGEGAITEKVSRLWSG